MRLATLALLCALPAAAHAYDTLSVAACHKQKAFPSDIPAGNYSGIAWLGGDRYAVANDKAGRPGFHIFEISIDGATGEILSARDTGFRGGKPENRDDEGIAYSKATGTVFISGELGAAIEEFDTLGNKTGRRAAVPGIYSKARRNRSLEALSYNDATETLWTCNEAPLYGDGEPPSPQNGEKGMVRLQSFGAGLQPLAAYAYQMDAPVEKRAGMSTHTIGVPAIAALDDGSLLVLERELCVPRGNIGSYVNCKIYQAFPSEKALCDTAKALPQGCVAAEKALVAQWRTRFNLTSRSFANYEGMCIGPELVNGGVALILVADSQNRYKGLLKDRLRTIVLR